MTQHDSAWPVAQKRQPILQPIWLDTHTSASSSLLAVHLLLFHRFFLHQAAVDRGFGPACSMRTVLGNWPLGTGREGSGRVAQSVAHPAKCGLFKPTCTAFVQKLFSTRVYIYIYIYIQDVYRCTHMYAEFRTHTHICLGTGCSIWRSVPTGVTIKAEAHEKQHIFVEVFMVNRISIKRVIECHYVNLFIKRWSCCMVHIMWQCGSNIWYLYYLYPLCLTVSPTVWSTQFLLQLDQHLAAHVRGKKLQNARSAWAEAQLQPEDFA